MQAGKLRHRVTIKALSNTQDSFGDESKATEVWTEVATVWADVKPLQGRELIQAQQLHQETTHQVTIRFRRGISPTNKLIFKDRELHILGFIDDGEDQTMLLLQCVERS